MRDDRRRSAFSALSCTMSARQAALNTDNLGCNFESRQKMSTPACKRFNAAIGVDKTGRAAGAGKQIEGRAADTDHPGRHASKAVDVVNEGARIRHGTRPSFIGSDISSCFAVGDELFESFKVAGCECNLRRLPISYFRLELRTHVSLDFWAKAVVAGFFGTLL